MSKNIKPKGGLDHAAHHGGLVVAGLKKMSEYDIIKSDIKEYGLKMDPDQTYAALLEMTKQPNYRILRANNTILMIDNRKDGTAEGIIFTADKPQAMVKSIKHLAIALKKGGFHELDVNSSGIAIETLMHRAGLKFQVTPIEIDGQEGHRLKVDLT